MEKTSASKVFDLCLYIFRRDLRLEDHRGLISCLKQSKQVIPSFFLDKKQLDQKSNEYFSHNLVQFMCESLVELNESLAGFGSRLHLFYGDIDELTHKVCKELKPQAIFFNEDVTPYALKRDSQITEISRKYGVETFSHHDMMMFPKDKIMQPNGKFYPKWTPYFKHASTFNVEKPIKNTFKNYIAAGALAPFEFPIKDLPSLYTANEKVAVRGGREAALKILKQVKDFKNYADTRDFPTKPTTLLSAYNKFGTVSIREVYHSITNDVGGGPDHPLTQQLYWRDFFYGVAYYNPHVLNGQAMKKELTDIPWENNWEWFEKWKNGKTGCPIVDAGMRQLNTTGYLPNRMRLVVASFLTKDLIIDWRWGEKYFASKLVDYDPSQNNGGWQWVAGTDSQPDHRVFNPKLQMEKFDKNCEYILKWIPELEDVPYKTIINWEEEHPKYRALGCEYPAPLVKHFDQKDKYLKLIADFNKARGVYESDDVKTFNNSRSGDNYNKGGKGKNSGKQKNIGDYRDYIKKF